MDDQLLFAKQKLAQIRAEISRVRTSDFHHPGAKRVLDSIDHGVFDRLLSDVEGVLPSASGDFLNELNVRVNLSIAHFHQIIGIILRSTNARNSFEVYDPVLRLAKGLLGSDTVLILSSEWDFVPFTMPSVFGGVPNCTVVGLPAMEAANALLTPLAGHELGHAVWRAKRLSDLTQLDRENALCDVFSMNLDRFTGYTGVRTAAEIRARLQTNEWGLVPLEVMDKVCEEIFCDMLGVRLFGMGYLYAFEYLAAPSLGDSDLREYPAFDARANYLATAMIEGPAGAAEDNRHVIGADDIPPWPRLVGYALRFNEEPPRLDAEDQFLLESAHKACERLVYQLRTLASEVCEGNEDGTIAIPSPSLDEAQVVLDRFRKGLPAVGNLADLVNAGWLGYLDPEFWEEKRSWKKKKFRFLNELVFKSLDVTEFAERGRENALEIR